MFLSILQQMLHKQYQKLKDNNLLLQVMIYFILLGFVGCELMFNFLLFMDLEGKELLIALFSLFLPPFSSLNKKLFCLRVRYKYLYFYDMLSKCFNSLKKTIFLLGTCSVSGMSCYL